MYRACWLLLCLLAGSQAVSVEVFTVPAAVAAGDSVTLRCQASSTADDALDYVKWWWLPRASGERHIIYQHIIGRKPQPVSTYLNVAVLNPEDNGIQVSDLKPIHSGTFICEAASTYNEVRKQQPLIVYSPGTGPRLNASAVADGPDAGDEPDVRVVCEANDVAPYPELQLTVDGEELKVPSVVSDSVAGVYDVEATATFSAEALEGKEVRCELLYRDEVPHPVYRDLLVYQPSGAGGGSRPSVMWIFLLSAAIPVCFASLL